MADMQTIDKKLVVQNKIGREDITWFDLPDDRFLIYGLDRSAFPELRRIPADVAAATNEGYVTLATNTAGGRVVLTTDSPFIAVRMTVDGECYQTMPILNSAGCDIYLADDDEPQYYGAFLPPVDRGLFQYEQKVDMIYDRSNSCQPPIDPGAHRWLINLPTYAAVKAMQIGIQKDAALLPSRPLYGGEPPIIFYGSSITQGACASRPGNAYTAVLSRMLKRDHRNFGFSGSSHGEQAMADYIAKQPMCAFVMDYDHNATSPEMLRDTHYRFYETIRKAQPNLPILMVTRPMARPFPEDERKAAILASFNRAKQNGDRRVWFLDGEAITAGTSSDCLVDGCHPNDFGFYLMAAAMKPILRDMLK